MSALLKHIPFRDHSLDYAITKAQLSRIFRMETANYTDEPNDRGLEIRVAAGYPVPSVRDYEHGFGDTQALHAKGSASVYVNLMKYGRMSTFDGFINHLINTVKNIPLVLIHSKKYEAILEQAANHNPVPHPCEQSIVARTSILSDDPKKTLFTLRIDCTDGKNDDYVTLRDIFMPVVDDNGIITGKRKLDAYAPDANADIIRSLIFMKLVTDQMRDGNPIDTKRLLGAVEKLPLTNESDIKDYLTYQPG